MCENSIRFNEELSRGYFESAVHTSAHILFPKNLPIKITVAGIRTIVHVGEFAIIPAGRMFAINSSPERYCIDFDFRLVKNNPDFTVLLPIIINPCIYHPVSSGAEKNTGYTTWYTSAFAESHSLLQSGGNTLQAPGQGNTVRFRISPAAIVREITDLLLSGSLHFPNTFAESEIFRLYSMLGEEILTNGFHGKHETAASPAVIRKLSASIQFILDNHGAETGLDEVAEAAGYSRTHYSKLFKEFYQFSFYDYLTDVRVASAAKLLTETDLSIAEAGETAGFSSSSTFNRVFKQKTGLSPRDYRRI